MEPLFQFLGSYWWLVFPLMGVMGGVGSAWERSARRRHKRRLEVLHAKAELKAAQAAARGNSLILPATGAQSPADATIPGGAAPGATQLERLFAAHDAVTARWLEYELDVAKLIAFPAMSDGRQPLTAAFLRAKRVADGLRPASAKARLTKDQLAEYRNAVADFEVAFDVAERDARRIKDSSFTVVERKRLDTAKQLLTIAIDQAATPAERQVAYRRVREELDGLISLSDEAIEVLEGKVSLELTTGRAPETAVPGVRRPSTTPPAARPAAASTPERADAAPSRDRLPSAPAPWAVPARTSDTAPGRVIRPKPHP
ncbi:MULTISPECIES: hypothetical protein [unclassified Microbacterium]|uniref:hypothetical protein n=1 Tax=unclassified Microbacterium TaxID=2609290 RepID=UPI00214B10FA|nr:MULTISPECIES: hypothetical protein [unclassified Microbacterium]MCR2808249.1 hypothetical protein [Microbacterium sp. zg.B185]WIM19295.1 hypothetical protein QNO12_00300 [Microbacterium sp. zg-B185]